MTEFSATKILDILTKSSNVEKSGLDAWKKKNPDTFNIYTKYVIEGKPINQLNSQDQSNIYKLKKYYPEAFKAPIVPEVVKTPTEIDRANSANRIEQLDLTGVVNNKDNMLVTNAISKGYLPELKNTSVVSKLMPSQISPLNMLMQALPIFPRTVAQIGTQIYRGNKGMNALAEIGKAAIEPIIDKKSEYSGTGFTELYNEMFANTAFTKEFEFAKDWENGNWGQRLFSGIAASPADIVGFMLDIVIDPLTYLGGGFAKGAKTGAVLADDLIKGGVKIAPKGMEIGLSKAGKVAKEVFKEAKYGEVIKAIDEGKVLPSVFGIGGTDDVAKVLAKKTIEDKVVNEFIQQVATKKEALNFLDMAGIKVGNTTILPGYKIAQGFGKIKGGNLGTKIGELANENHQIPKEIINVKSWLQSAGEAEKNAFVKDFVTVIKGADETDLGKIQKYLWVQSDMERANNKLNAVVEKIVNTDTSQGKLFGGSVTKALNGAKTRYYNLLDKYKAISDGLSLSENQLKVAEDLKGFWKKVADQYTAATGKPLNTYEFYSPIRYIKDEEAKLANKFTTLGAKEQPFMQGRKITMAQAEKLIAEGKLGAPKDMVVATTQRLREQEQTIFRSRMLDEIKQFGFQKEVPTTGISSLDSLLQGKVAKDVPKNYVEVTGVPELKGFYVPKEYGAVLNKTMKTFFGVDSVAQVAKIYDKGLTVWKRWALATPGYHFRNFFTDNVSGLMENGVKWYNPKYWSDMAAIRGAEHKLITLNGVKVYADDVTKKFLRSGVLTTQTAVEGLPGTGSKLMKTISPAEWSLKFGNERESIGRILQGVIDMDAGLSEIEVAASVKKVLFDYAHSLTPAEQNIGKRIIPFLTWQKNNIRRQVELLLTKTGRYAAIPKTINFVENISDTPENYKEFRADYLSDIGAIATPLRQPGLPDFIVELRNKDNVFNKWLDTWQGKAVKTTQAGDMLSYIPNFGFSDWSKLSPRDIASSFAPGLKIIGEYIADRNIFTGATIMEGQKDKPVPLPVAKVLNLIPDGILNKVGIHKALDDSGNVYISPLASYILNGLLPQYALTQRGFSGTDNTPYQNLSSILGVKYTPYNEIKAEGSYKYNWDNDAQLAVGNYQQLRGVVNKGTPDEKPYQLPSTTQIQAIYKNKYISYIENRYIPEIKATYGNLLEIKSLMDLVGTTQEDKDYINSKLQPYYDEVDTLKNKSINDLKLMLKDAGIDLKLGDVEAIIAEKALQIPAQ